MSNELAPPEIIAIASGKGGTGKTLLAACLGHALARAGHSVLLVDADTATDGLSLFLLGEAGMAELQESSPESTLRRYLDRFAPQGQTELDVRRIERGAVGDDRVAFQLLISGGGLYGEQAADLHNAPALGPAQFRAAIQALFRQLHELPYDYVVVDTRGGSAYESTDLCALADGFILVTDPDPTSFSQDRNLLRRINAAGIALERRTVLRSILVNRARDADELPFRLELEREFGVELTNTHTLPFDLEALRAYDRQKLPYEVAEASAFSYATLLAFAGIFQLVTAPWPQERVQRWNALVAGASEAVEARKLSASVEQQLEAPLAGAAEPQQWVADADVQGQPRAATRGSSRRRVALLSLLAVAGLAGAGLALWRVPSPVGVSLPGVSSTAVSTPAVSPPVVSLPAVPNPTVQDQFALQPSASTDPFAPATPEVAPALRAVAEPARPVPPSPRRIAPPVRESVRNEVKRPPPPAAGLPSELAAPREERSEWSDFGGRK